jgi:hypothetical protein
MGVVTYVILIMRRLIIGDRMGLVMEEQQDMEVLYAYFSSVRVD